MLIIVEGGDGSGKTTLVNKLAELGYETIRVPRNLSTDNVWRALAHEKLVVSDRSFITDVVYRMYDGKKPLTTITGQLNTLNQGVKIILCDTPTSFEDGMARGEDNITDKASAMFIKDMYFYITRYYEIMLKVPVLYYNWQDMNIQSVIDFIGSPGFNKPVDIQNKKKEGHNDARTV